MNKRIINENPRAFRLLLGCLIAAGIGIGTPLLSSQTSSSVSQKTGTSGTSSPDTSVLTGELQKGTPDFTTVLPKGKSITNFGGWTRVSPPKRDPVYAYVDKIGKIPITVSQQPLPKDLADQPDEQIQNLAEVYAANTVVKAGGTTVYIGTSGKGPQSVIFTKNKLLILIKASAKISNSKWGAYVESLQP